MNEDTGWGHGKTKTRMYNIIMHPSLSVIFRSSVFALIRK